MEDLCGDEDFLAGRVRSDAEAEAARQPPERLVKQRVVVDMDVLLQGLQAPGTFFLKRLVDMTSRFTYRMTNLAHGTPPFLRLGYKKERWTSVTGVTE